MRGTVFVSLVFFSLPCAALISLPTSTIASSRTVGACDLVPSSPPHSLVSQARRRTSLSMASSGSIDLSPRSLVSRGMNLFSSGDVAGSIDLFDKADAAVPDGSLRPYLWQRGLSYYYADRFREGSDQFRLDVRVNPLDVEEIVWDIACQARLDPGGTFPPQNKMALPEGRKDRRKIMSTVYSLFRGDGATEQDLFTAGHDGSTSDEFYSLFYLGLYCESRGETGKAASYMKSAASSKYAMGFGASDYMTSVARVHCKLRGWL
eukprot:CAMPEP_0197441656 /NCGR_PEP_ID=MMETSP1175-20131217/7890_1 /TAXON_ID=1003142 /ORGANISM="Triceratium dubium, Strain CCMP147" /LENGTH=262 /DNA_ID=CAMNT_0042971979 /DNA_START=39 /DNA_END=827 /DNA_ORIENTATION=-